VNLLMAVQMYESQILVTVASTLCSRHDMIEMEFFPVEEVFSTVCAGIPLSTRDSLRLGGQAASLRLSPADVARSGTTRT